MKQNKGLLIETYVDPYVFDTVGGEVTGAYYPNEPDEVMGYYESVDKAKSAIINWLNTRTSIRI